MNHPSSQKYFPALTGVRAIAALMVYVHHFNPFSESLAGGFLHDIVHEMHTGVTLFFVLSGFLISYRYMDTPNLHIRSYLINRIARIYPLYFILTTLIFIGGAIIKHEHRLYDLFLYLLNISFLKGFFNDLKFTGIAQGWSLTVEETFYLSAPLLFYAIRRYRYALMLLPVLLIGIGLILCTVFYPVNFYGFFKPVSFMFNFTFFGRCIEFFTGILLALIFKKNNPARSSNIWTYSGVFLIITCIYLLSTLKENGGYGTGHPLGIFINNAALPITGISVLFYGLLTEKTILSKILSTRFFILLGKSSYAFYLIHIGPFTGFIHKITGNYLLILIIKIIFSIVLFKVIEEPLNGLIRKKAGKPRYVLKNAS